MKCLGGKKSGVAKSLGGKMSVFCKVAKCLGGIMSVWQNFVVPKCLSDEMPECQNV